MVNIYNLHPPAPPPQSFETVCPLAVLGRYRIVWSSDLCVIVNAKPKSVWHYYFTFPMNITCAKNM